jgi:hypothetical protein
MLIMVGMVFDYGGISVRPPVRRYSDEKMRPRGGTLQVEAQAQLRCHLRISYADSSGKSNEIKKHNRRGGSCSGSKAISSERWKRKGVEIRKGNRGNI